MNKNYKNFVLAFVLSALTAGVQASWHKDGYQVWYASNYTGTELSAEQRKIINAGTMTYWNSGEPNNSSGEHCAVQQNGGNWNDTKCDASKRAACFNGSTWTISAAVNLNAVTAQPACGTAKFAAPTTAAQRNSLLQAMQSAGVSEVWINANDRTTEGRWVINNGAADLFDTPAWNSGEPNNFNGVEHCAEQSTNSLFNDQNCSLERALACTNSTFSQWKVTLDKHVYSTEPSLNHICQQAFGLDFQFAAPRTAAERSALTTAINQANSQSSETITSAWINASDQRAEGFWSMNTGLFNWAPGEPNFANGQCVVARQGDGKWQMADCNSRAKLLCSDGVNWVFRNANHQFSWQAHEACSRPDTDSGTSNPYVNYRLATPETQRDMDAVALLMNGQTSGTVAWINLKRVSDIGTWLRNESYADPQVNGGNLKRAVWYDLMRTTKDQHTGTWTDYNNPSVQLTAAQALLANKGVRVYFDSEVPEPNDSGNCVQMYVNVAGKEGLWDDTACGNSKPVACFDGFDWAISNISVALGTSTSNSTDNSSRAADESAVLTAIKPAHDACALVEKDGVTGNFRFAAPVSFDQSQRLLTIARNSQQAANGVWINANDKRFDRVFVFNLGAEVLSPFWNNGEPKNVSGSEDCAVQRQDNGLWGALSCTEQRRVACYNPNLGANGDWKLTAAAYAFSNPVLLSNRCEQEFGGQYKFYAPETLSQREALRAITPAGTDVYINANDQDTEGHWRYNVEINNWAQGQPGTSTSERCVAASATDSFWRTKNCAQSLPVACTTGDQWYFTRTNVSLENFANGQASCDALGRGYLFQAPRSLDEAKLMHHSAKLAGVGGEFWINGNRIEQFSTWVWNQRFVQTPVWGSNEPNGGTGANCAVLNNNVDASWADESCSSNIARAYLCRNGNNWQVSTIQGSLTDFSAAASACATIGAGWVFAAPTTYNENIAAKNAMGANQQVWVNATDAMREGSWVLNAAPITAYPNWAAGQPDNGGILAAAESANVRGEDCVYQDQNGKWFDTSCTTGAEYSWACTDGNVWKVTRAKGAISNFSIGHKACFNEYGSAFVFAAPLNKNDAMQIDFARLQASTELGSAINNVWLNMTDGGVESNQTGTANLANFRKNLPFTNWMNFAPGEEPANACAYKSSRPVGEDNPWNIASCTDFAAHYACSDGNSWKVATSKGVLVSGNLQITPIVGQDYWSYERGTNLCKEQHGSQFYFAAPVTAAEELALDAAIRATPAQVKNTWINYYYVNAISSINNRWFANRIKLGVWQKPVFRNQNNADCAVLHPDGSWTDAACDSNYAYACFNGAWSVTGLTGAWEQGFAHCDNQLASLFAVPRTPDEMDALLSEMGNNPVWINMSDTALESQWIANRLRFAWWRAAEPSNLGNRDCALIGKDGEWFAGRCSLEHANFACRTVNTSGNINWNVTTEKGYWADGFGACQRKFPGSEFFAPQGYGSHAASTDQGLLAAVMANGTAASAWMNLSDQDVEGNWRAHREYSDWAMSSLLDQNRDCGFIDRVAGGAGTWNADVCKYTSSTPTSRGYACTNGNEWKLVNTAPQTNKYWSEGFAACQTLGAGWRYAAPSSAAQNAKLKLAMELAGLEQVWINAHDRITEGEWIVNGEAVNFAPVADTSQTATVVNELTNNIQLHAALDDDEEQGISSAVWSLVSDSRFVDVAQSDVVVTNNTLVAGTQGRATVTASYSTPRLLKEEIQLTFKVTATDVAPAGANQATSETYVMVRVKPPRIAAWDFNDARVPQRDITGNGHDALNTQANPLPPVVNGALSVRDQLSMIVPGLARDPNNGLVIPANAYTIAFRMSVEEAQTVFGGVLQKGNDGFDRQPAIFTNSNNSSALHSTNATNQSNNRNVDPALPFQQWVNVIYSKRPDGFDVYIDGVLKESYNFAAGETSVANTGDLRVGRIPGAGESFRGLIDDIQIFNRVLTAAERAQVLPPPPVGTVSFKLQSSQVDEFAAEPNNKVTIEVERTRGSFAPLTVYVDLDALNSTVTRGTLADMQTATHPADIAIADYVNGSGVPVTWNANTKGTQSFVVTLDKADDMLREGTEVARFEFSETNGAEIGEIHAHTLRLNDLTTNPYGNFSVVGPTPNVVLETSNATHSICFVRESGSSGEVTVNYAISGNAVAAATAEEGDFTYLNTGVVPTGPTGSVTFANGDGADKCFNIQVFSNDIAGQADRSINVTITGLDHDAGIDPVLTAQTQASIVIRDFAAGTFAFTADSFICKEPNQSTKVPAQLRATEADLTCNITVVRTGTGITSPAAQLAVSIPLSDSISAYTALLNWPAITPAAPATPQTETQTITVDIVNDNIQEADQQVVVTLAPKSGETITQAQANLTIIDVTEPAVLTLSTTTPTVKEGQNAVFNIQRSENLRTQFTYQYEVSVDGKLPGKTDADYVDFSQTPRVGTLSFSSALNSSNTHQLVLNTIDTLEATATVDLRVTLKNPSTPRTVGMGTISNVYLDNSINQTDATAIIQNTWIDNSYSVRISQGSKSATYVNGATTPVLALDTITTAFNPARANATLEFIMPAKTSTQIEHSHLRYTWSIVGSWHDGLTTKTNDNSLITTRSGVVNYSSAIALSTAMKMPFVLKETQFLVELKIEGGNGVDYPEVFTTRIPVIAKPVWRYFMLAGKDNPCLSNDPRRETCGGTNDTDDDLWIYSPDNKLLMNKASYNNGNGTAFCFQLDTNGNAFNADDMYMRACNPNTVGQQMNFSGSSILKINGKFICAIGDRNLNSLSIESSCSGDDKNWSWGAPQ